MQNASSGSASDSDSAASGISVDRERRRKRAAKERQDPPDGALSFLSPAGEPFSIRRLIHTQNPFYVISALLVLLGVRASFGGSDQVFSLVGVLGGYCVALAAAGVLIVRVGSVWEDARSLFLLLILLFLAMSVSADELLLGDHRDGVWVLVFGAVVSVLCTEGVLGLAKIRLRLGYRIPYYALLLLFFAWPGVVAHFARLGDARWAVLAFPLSASLGFVALLPAVWKGRAYGGDNGTPWRWPLFPGALFAFLGLAAALRTHWMAASFLTIDPRPRLFLLAPFALAAGILLTVALRNAAAIHRRLVWLCPVIALILAASATRGDPLVRWMAEQGAAPTFLVSWAVVAFFGAVWLRRDRFAPYALAVALGVAAFCPRDAPGLVSAPNVWAMRAAFLLLEVWALRKRDTPSLVMGGLAFAGWLRLDMAAGALVSVHALAAWWLVLALVRRDAWAVQLRRVLSLAAFAAGVVAAASLLVRVEASVVMLGALWFAIAFVIAAVHGCTVSRWVVRVLVALGLYVGALRLHGLAGPRAIGRYADRSGLSQGGLLLFWSTVTFGVGLAVSMSKANGVRGAIGSWWSRAFADRAWTHAQVRGESPRWSRVAWLAFGCLFVVWMVAAARGSGRCDPSPVLGPVAVWAAILILDAGCAASLVAGLSAARSGAPVES